MNLRTLKKIRNALVLLRWGLPILFALAFVGFFVFDLVFAYWLIFAFGLVFFAVLVLEYLVNRKIKAIRNALAKEKNPG